jgi:hypothetical protein
MEKLQVTEEKRMTIKTLKSVLTRALEDCEMLEDDTKVHLESNTYFLREARFFLGVSGFDGGYLDLYKIPEAAEDDEEFDDPE